jgi:prophage regulatory protein
MNNNIPSTTIIKLPEVQRRTGRSRSSIYADMDAGLFPQKIKTGVRSVGWSSAEIDS